MTRRPTRRHLTSRHHTPRPWWSWPKDWEWRRRPWTIEFWSRHREQYQDHRAQREQDERRADERDQD